MPRKGTVSDLSFNRGGKKVVVHLTREDGDVDLVRSISNVYGPMDDRRAESTARMIARKDVAANVVILELSDFKREELTTDWATKIVDAFGPNSTLFECHNTEELIGMWEQDGDLIFVEELVQAQFQVEKIACDEHNEAAFHHEEGTGKKGHHQKVIDEGKAMLEGIRTRLKVIGFEVN